MIAILIAGLICNIIMLIMGIFTFRKLWIKTDYLDLLDKLNMLDRLKKLDMLEELDQLEELGMLEKLNILDNIQRLEAELEAQEEAAEGRKWGVFFNWLIDVKGVDDPYVTLYSYMHGGDMERIQRFIESHPDLNMNITEGLLMQKYGNDYLEFYRAYNSMPY